MQWFTTHSAFIPIFRCQLRPCFADCSEPSLWHCRLCHGTCLCHRSSYWDGHRVEYSHRTLLLGWDVDTTSALIRCHHFLHGHSIGLLPTDQRGELERRVCEACPPRVPHHDLWLVLHCVVSLLERPEHFNTGGNFGMIFKSSTLWTHSVFIDLIFSMLLVTRYCLSISCLLGCILLHFLSARVQLYQFSSEHLRFCFNTFVLMKYPDGSAVRGFSLGATAGTAAPLHLSLCCLQTSKSRSMVLVSFWIASQGRWRYSWESKKHGKSRLDTRVASQMNNYSDIIPTILLVFPKLLHILSHTAHTQILEAVHVPCIPMPWLGGTLAGNMWCTKIATQLNGIGASAWRLASFDLNGRPGRHLNTETDWWHFSTVALWPLWLRASFLFVALT